MGTPVKDDVLVPVNYEQLSVSTVKGLTAAKFLKATRALIAVQDQDVRWRDDGTSPSTTVGMPLAADKDFMYVGPLSAIKFTAVTGTAKLNISYYN